MSVRTAYLACTVYAWNRGANSLAPVKALRWTPPRLCTAIFSAEKVYRGVYNRCVKQPHDHRRASSDYQCCTVVFSLGARLNEVTRLFFAILDGRCNKLALSTTVFSEEEVM
jgi:hypothetical protein